jgi:hypothetical protein
MFTLAFWKITAEAVLMAAGTAFLGAFAVQGGYTVRGLEAAAVAAGAGALAAFLKQLGAVQATKGTPIVAGAKKS